MKPFRLFHLALLVFASFAGVRAQNLTMGVTASPTNPAPNAVITYTITVTNTTTASLGSVSIVNNFTSAMTVVSNSTSLDGTTITTNSAATQATIAINLFPTGAGAVQVFTLGVVPQSTGQFGDLVAVSSPTATGMNTNVVVTVQPLLSDLGVRVSDLPEAILIGDRFTYKVTLTNAGPSAASPNVTLQTTFSGGGVISNSNVIGVSPEPSGGRTVANNVLSMSVGALTNLATKTFLITLQPTSTNSLALTTTVALPTGQNSDTNAANDSVTNLVTVKDLVSNTLKILVSTTPAFNPQTGLMDQYVGVQNVSTSRIDSVRLFATDLVAPNRLYNATGTNAGFPYVASVQPLEASNTMTFHLEYFFANRSTTNIVTLQPVEAPTLKPPAPDGTILAQPKMVFTNSAFIVEFPSTVGKRYAVTYRNNLDTNGALTNFVASLPFITAISSRTQFVDDGPPRTATAPTNSASRIYQVIELP